MNNVQKIGIALEGGGAKGAYQIGVLKAILDLGIKFDCVAGTSIGALNATAYALEEYEKYAEHWKNTNFSFNIENTRPNNVKLLKLSEILNNVEEFEREYLNSEGIDPEKIISMFRDSIDEDLIRKSNIKLGISTYCLTDKKPLDIFIDDIPEGMLHEYIFASCNLPVFTPRKINGKHYIDGGIYNRLPLNMLTNQGYKTIIAVRLRKDKYDFSEYKNINFIDIRPDEYLCDTLKASPERIKWMIDKGYEDAYKILNDSIEFLK